MIRATTVYGSDGASRASLRCVRDVAGKGLGTSADEGIDSVGRFLSDADVHPWLCISSTAPAPFC